LHITRDKKNKVLVHHPDSGSGKTVELAASSHTRDALFTIIVPPGDNLLLLPIDSDKLESKWSAPTKPQVIKARLQMDALEALCGAVDAIYHKHKELFYLITSRERWKA